MDPAILQACNNSAELQIDGGDSGIFTCGSVTVEILAGSVEASFTTGGPPVTSTMTPPDILTFDPGTLTITNDGTSTATITFLGQMIELLPGESITIVIPRGGDSDEEPPTIGKNLSGTKQMVNNGFCIDSDCFTVTKLFHEEFKLYEMMSGTHTLSTLIYCAQGVQHCNYSAIGIMPYDKDMNDAVWKIEIKRNHLGEWTPLIFDPEGFLGEVTITTQIVSDRFLQVSYTIEFKNKETPPMKVGVQLRDDKNAVRNFYFNEGVKFLDAYAYPYVESAFEEPLKVEPLCLNENPNNRNTCAFEKVKEWTTQKAESTLNEILNGNYVYNSYYRSHQ
jgi:hypothetical protein